MRKIIICVLAVLMLTGCAKVTRREYHAEPVTVLSADRYATYQTIEGDGKNIHVINHPDSYTVAVLWNGQKKYLYTAAAYELCRYFIGETVFAVVETRIYTNDEQKQRLLEVFALSETAEKVCKAYVEGK